MANYNNFTDRARKVMALAGQNAMSFDPLEVRPIDILLGIIKEGSGIGCAVLKNMGVVDTSIAKQTLDPYVSRDRTPRTSPSSQYPSPNEASKAIISQASEVAKRLSHVYIGTEHLLIAVAEQADPTVTQALQALGVDITAIPANIRDLLEPGTDKPAPSPAPVATSKPLSPRDQRNRDDDLAFRLGQILLAENLDTKALGEYIAELTEKKRIILVNNARVVANIS